MFTSSSNDGVAPAEQLSVMRADAMAHPATVSSRIGSPSTRQPDLLENPWKHVKPAPTRPRLTTLTDFSGGHAAPLSPLRDRDLKEMTQWFATEEMGEIERDITRCLLMLWPEPCWEDDAFEFLQDYL